MRNYIKFIIYLYVFIGFSSAKSGSYDDYFKAIELDNPIIVQNLLHRGFDANTLNPDGLHGLLLALRQPSPKVLTLLLQQPRLAIDLRSPKDETPLMIAALKGQITIVQELIKRGADVNKTGWTPLHYAATGGHSSVIQVLLEEHAYIDAESPNRTTPLMMAAMYGSVSAVKTLLEFGADPTLRNDQGLAALDFAQRANRHDSVRVIEAFLQSKGAEHPPTSLR